MVWVVVQQTKVCGHPRLEPFNVNNHHLHHLKTRVKILLTYHFSLDPEAALMNVVLNTL